MINTNFIAFLAGSTIGALSAISGIAITAKIFTPKDTDEILVDDDCKFFVNSVKDFLIKNNIETEEVNSYINTVEDVCKIFNTDYRKFLVGLYDHIIRNDCDKLVQYLESIQTILNGYLSARWMDTDKNIRNIIIGEPIENDMEDFVEEETVDVADEVTESVEI